MPALAGDMVGRGWRLRGGDLDDSVVTDVIFDGMISRLDTAAGFLGVIVALDRVQKDWRTVTFWASAEARMRTSVLEGVGVDEPELIALLVQHADSAIVPAPGCVGALVLVDQDRPTVIASTFWTDPTAAARTLPLAQVADTAVLNRVSRSSVTTGIYEILSYRPVR